MSYEWLIRMSDIQLKSIASANACLNDWYWLNSMYIIYRNHLYVRQDSFMCNGWGHLCVMSGVIYVNYWYWLNSMYIIYMNYLCVRHDSFMCNGWGHLCVMTPLIRAYKCAQSYILYMSDLYVRQDSFMWNEWGHLYARMSGVISHKWPHSLHINNPTHLCVMNGIIYV